LLAGAQEVYSGTWLSPHRTVQATTAPSYVLLKTGSRKLKHRGGRRLNIWRFWQKRCLCKGGGGKGSSKRRATTASPGVTLLACCNLQGGAGGYTGKGGGSVVSGTEGGATVMDVSGSFASAPRCD
ncbi:hypothetical protein KUCAC02_019957, partial [Chaenocephalus aceratus]